MMWAFNSKIDAGLDIINDAVKKYCIQDLGKAVKITWDEKQAKFLMDFFGNSWMPNDNWQFKFDSKSSH